MNPGNKSPADSKSIDDSGSDDRPTSLERDPEKAVEKSDEGSNEEQKRSTLEDGGLRGWMRVLGCFLILANTMGLQSSFGVFQAFYQGNLLSTYSSFDITWIGTIQIFCSASGGIISGPLFDLGYDKSIVMLGCFFAVFGYMMTSLSSTYWQLFLAQGVTAGLSGTCVFAPAVALSAISFPHRKSLAVGITTSGFAFGAVIYPIVFRQLQPSIGFPWATRVMAFIALGCFLIAYPLVYWKTPRPKSKARDVIDISAWKEPPYVLFCLAVFFMYAGYWPPYFFVTQFASGAIGTSISLAFYIFAVSNAANFVARFTATLIADKLGIIEVLFASSLISMVIAFCWIAVNSLAGIIVWSIFWGYFSGVMSALFAAVIPSLSPSPSVIGTRLGMLNGLFGIGCLISPPIAGAIILAQGNRFNERNGYLGMQIWVGCCLVASTLLFIYPLVHLRRVRSQNAKLAT